MRRVSHVQGGSDPIGTAMSLKPRALVVDVEPLLVHWKSPKAQLQQRVPQICELIGPDVSVIFCTNSSRTIPEALIPERAGFIMDAHKPWSIAWAQGLPQPIVFVGDTVLTDGDVFLSLR